MIRRHNLQSGVVFCLYYEGCRDQRYFDKGCCVVIGLCAASSRAASARMGGVIRMLRGCSGGRCIRPLRHWSSVISASDAQGDVSPLT